MGRSDRGYVAIDSESKRARNLKKLEKRKEDTGEIRRFPHTLRQVKKLKELKDIKNGFTIRENAKRKRLDAAERSHNIFEADRLKRELVLLEASRKKTIREQTAKMASKGSYPQKIQQAILDLERQKKLLQTRAPSDLDASRKAILYIESQKKNLTNLLSGEVQSQEVKEVLKEKKTTKELLDKSPPPKIIMRKPKPTPTPPPPPPPELLPQIDYQLSDNRAKRIAKMGLRIRNIQREVKYLEGEIARRGRKLGVERIGDIRRDGSIIGVDKSKGTAGKIDNLHDLHALKLKLQKDIQFLINEKKNEDKIRSVESRKHAFNKLQVFDRYGQTRGRDQGHDRGRSVGEDRSTRRMQRQRRISTWNRQKQARVTTWEEASRLGYSGIYLRRYNEIAKYNERTRTPREVIFLIVINQEEYDYIASNNWLSSLGGYNQFAIGIASVADKVKFKYKDACDIYVDISQIAGRFQNSLDIPQEEREKIELLCGEGLQPKMKKSFFYISTDKLFKPPFERPTKIVCIMPIHKRVNVTIETVNRLKQQKYLDDIILVGDSSIEEVIAEKTGVSYLQYYNDPLSYKVQAGVDTARLCNPDAIMISGSDNWLADNWTELCAPFIPHYDVIGVDQWWSARIIKSRPLEIMKCRYNNRGDPIGGGRIVTAPALDKINWGLYVFKYDKGLDGRSWNLLQGHIKSLRVKIVPGLINLGIKGSWEQRDSYEVIKS